MYSLFYTDNSRNENERLVCPECQLVFDTSTDLEDHIKTLHPNTSVQVLVANTPMQQSSPVENPIYWEFVLSNRGSLTLCINDFMFKRQKQEGNKIYYYCCAPDCKASVQTSINDDVILSTLKENHDHPNHKNEIIDMRILHSIRKRAIDEPNLPVSELLRYASILSIH